MAFKFVTDQIRDGKMYPGLAQWDAWPYNSEWYEFGKHWPFTTPLDLYEYCCVHKYPCEIYEYQTGFPDGAFYPVSFGFFNFDIDYFSLMKSELLSDLRSHKIKILFYYHEGDSPFSIKQRLDTLCLSHSLPLTCYKFVSGNTRANEIPGFVYFPDHELLYWNRGKKERGIVVHTDTRPRLFTALNRTHKWWRATAMTDLWRNGLLDNSYWSYRTDIDCGDIPENNPIEISQLPDIHKDIAAFLSGAPYTCDELDPDQHNDHRFVETEFYLQSYCSIVLETHFDADNSGGAFLTEKTFKAIKHGHPFVIVGCPGSLETLRQLGYRVFDHVIDNRYDQESNNTRRWKMILNTVKQIKNRKNHQRWFEKCRDDIEHNQRLFSQSKYDRLNSLHQKLYEPY
jgi:hypothetical protein